jgi:hypothetical protein
MAYTSHAEIIEHHAYHPPPTPEVADRHSAVRAETCALALKLTALVPRGPELEEALKCVREAMFWANAGIACDPRGPVNAEPVDRLG